MNYKKIFWGVLLIIIGVLFILNNLNLLDIDWGDIFSLWPLLLVFWGISIIPIKGYLKLILSILALILGLVIVNQYEERDFFHFKRYRHFKYNDWESKELNIPLDSNQTFAVLSFDAAAGNYTIKGVTDDLIDFKKWGSVGDYKLLREDRDSMVIINMELDDFIKRRYKGSKVNMSLNPLPVWDFQFDVGAANIELDLRKFKTREIEINGGASSVEILLGNKYPETDLSIDAGAASIDIKIPASSSCELSTSTVLSSREIKGFEKIERGLYRTPDFSKAHSLIYINVDAAVSSLEISRY